MCRAISGVAVYNSSTDSIKVYSLRYEDSHTKIRDVFKIRDDDGAGATRQTPVELIPVRGLEKLEDMDFVFDDTRPDWWTDEMTESAKNQLLDSWKNRFDGKVLKFEGYLNLNRLTSIPEGVTLDVVSIPEGVTVESGGHLDLSRLTSIPEGVNIKAGGCLYLSSLTSIPKGVTIEAGCAIYLRSLTKPKEIPINIKANRIYWKR